MGKKDQDMEERCKEGYHVDLSLRIWF